MKKLITILAVGMLVLTACSGGNDDKQSKSTHTKSESKTKTKSETKSSNTNVNENELKEFALGIYQANKISEIDHIKTLPTDNIRNSINRQFQSGDFSKSNRFSKTATNARAFKDVDDDNRYLVTLETKTKDNKKHKVIWLQKTVQFKTNKNGKVNDFEEIGSREIFNEQD